MENKEPISVYNDIEEEMIKAHHVERGQLFGKKCLKYEGRAFAAFFQDDMVFKLKGHVHKQALKLEESKLWDPSGKNIPMKDWIQVGNKHMSDWRQLANYAIQALGE
ncbi:hypothetical protein PASE110613_07090 [Paenibacillus sediminis]|uniref:TfoX N-terminal domain-containing protein n=1 Tax=Paenibacillus sediminis TaxID=664909 RepID=A0ABS4H2E9_9BACL|nr:hypothetical protein [Paenibacillus sediminis]MBP1936552.1 hypothetical protein [Paenibacillus sediminis]